MRLYDTFSGEKKEFAPWDGRTVRLYVCGVTPYDTTHIGHAMTYLTFDVLSRYCQYLGWRVKYVQNVTDIVTCGAKKHDISDAQERLRVLGGILGMSGVIYGRG